MRITATQARTLEKVTASFVRGGASCAVEPGVAARLASKGLVTVVDKVRLRECGGHKKFAMHMVVPTAAGCDLVIALKLGGQALSI